ncbi:PTS transporter subunit EIIA [bacterium]|nr:PTS transporter subunit EIIA [bacterium]
MQLSDIIAADRVKHVSNITSKKRALEEVAGLLSNGAPQLSDTNILASLAAREKLGSTGLGGGVAIPHGRMRGTEESVAAMLILDQGVDFDSSDGQPVDLVLGMVVPQEATQTHLSILKSIAEMLSDETQVAALRAADDDAAAFDLLKTYSDNA